MILQPRLASTWNLGALQLSKEDKMWVAIIGLIFCVSMTASLPLITIASGLAVLASGFLWKLMLGWVSGEPAN